MAVSLLALDLASDLDWAVLIRLLAGATIYVQAVQSPANRTGSTTSASSTAPG